MSSVIAGILLGTGTLVAVLASLAAVRARTAFRRLHYLTVLTSVASPLIGAAAIVVDGFGLSGASVLAIVVLLAVTGPILGAATGRLNARRDGVIEVATPE
ncbi:monovalent cation/H(+) antiporter subunit G [Amycolatopsis alkalitolerans]|uniref:Monovalent cation/H(+) antiporter subunit G n=1 Tax=Amycolatopsis alkalitolerans TaxID=2547244 RepID=A0A5C4LWD7_9PSEU|nr:monovalent cation/H(+) antiporter subunit G [Amycolatopsis alkalitolerans]TNC23751.1 monovalent cation/H(+) antiporter subunit G [Amycolatopsis alkalitolerans]